MPLLHAGTGRGVEAAAVVRDGKDEPSALERPRDIERRCVAVAHGVDDEFAYDAQDVVELVVGNLPARHVEAYMQLRSGQMRLEGYADGLVDVVFLECLVAEVPDAVPQLPAAGINGLERDSEMLGR